MHYSAALFSIALAASSTLAVPLSTNSTLHFLGKRDAVCASNFRDQVDKSSCLPNQAAFTLTAPSTINHVALPDQTLGSVPDGVQCDHTIEIQLLDAVAKKSGFCDVLAALINTNPTTLSKATLLQPAADHISAVGNLNFLDGTVNNRKKTVVSRSLKGSAQQTTALDTAVGNYLTLVGQGVLPIATQLDADIAAIITQATTVNTGLVAGTGRTDPIRKIKQPLQDALTAYKSSVTVTAAWNKVLTDAA